MCQLLINENQFNYELSPFWFQEKSETNKIPRKLKIIKT